MIRTEIVHGTHQIDAGVQGRQLPPAGMSTAHQRGDPRAKGSVEAPDVCGIDDATSLRCLDQYINHRQRALDHAVFDAADAPAGVTLHHLGDTDVVPRAQAGAPNLAGVQRFAKRVLDSFDVATKAADADQQRAAQGYTPHQRHQACDQRRIALGTEHAAQPHNDPLSLHPHLIGLHLSQITRLAHQLLMLVLAVLPSGQLVTLDGPFIPPKGPNSRLGEHPYASNVITITISSGSLCAR